MDTKSRKLSFADKVETRKIDDNRNTRRLSTTPGKAPACKKQSILKKSESSNGSNSDLSTRRSINKIDDADIASDTELFETAEDPDKEKAFAGNNASQTRPDWYEDLNHGQITMFKEVFQLLDRDGGGSIDSGEILTVMKDLDIDVTKDEIEKVLSELDSDGNGEIDFDEFLYAMAETERYMEMMADPERDLEAEEDGVYSRRQRLFFTAITRFAIKNSMGEIERYYTNKMRQAPHVISFYTAGVRLIGLNDRQLEQQLRRMQKASQNQDSPYAKPLPFVSVRPRKKKRKNVVRKSIDANALQAGSANRRYTKAETTIEVVTEDQPSLDEMKEDLSTPDSLNDEEDEIPDLFKDGVPRTREGRRRTAITPDSASGDLSEVVKMLRDLAGRGSIVARLPDVHLIPAIRTKLTNMSSSDQAKQRKPFSDYKGTEHPEFMNTTKITAHLRRKGARISSKPRGWMIPRIERGQAPLPVISFPKGHDMTFTVENVPAIRKQVSTALDKYYSKLKKAQVRTAWDHWDYLYVDMIRSTKLRDNFRKVYCAYSPHKEEDVFVIAPWIPGPSYTTGAKHPTATPTPFPELSRCHTSHGRPSKKVHVPSRPNSVCS